MKFALFATLVCAAMPALAVPVSVAVVGPDSKPIVGARLSSSDVDYSRQNVESKSEHAAVAGVFAWNWDGDFAPRDEDDEKPRLRVRIEAPGMATQFQIIVRGQTTIALQPSRDWGGVVLDQSQKPVAGVTLRLNDVSLPAAADDIENLADVTFAVTPQTAVTDTQGRWSFAGLPARGGAQITLSAPNYVAQNLWPKFDAGEAAPITVTPGGAITGRLLAPDGAPVAGRSVRVFSYDGGAVFSDAQGRFVVNGVEPGRATLYVPGELTFGEVKPKLPPYIFDGFKRPQVEVGKTIDIGEFRAKKGLVVRARVVDAATKTPLPDAQFAITGNNGTNAVDDDGVLQTRVVPTDEDVDFRQQKIKSEGYIDYEIAADVLENGEEILDLGIVEMQRGQRFRGVVRMESGATPDGVKLPDLDFIGDKSEFASVGANGEFESPALKAGLYWIRLSGNDSGWEIVSKRNFTLPAWNKESPPLEIIVRRLTAVLPIIQKARGRVNDENGRGVAGVAIRARVMTDGGSYSPFTMTTDENGDFEFYGGSSTTAIVIENALHPDYILGDQAQIEVADGVATIRGLVAKKRGSVYSSHVAMPDGKPAANAWVVVVEARDYEPVQTDENGDFKMVDMPLTQFTLLAAKDGAWARQNASSAQPGATLTLQNSEFAVDRAQVLDEMRMSDAGYTLDVLFGAWDALGIAGVEHFLERDGELYPGVLARYGAELGRRDPAQLLERAPEWLRRAEGEVREDLEAEINFVRAASDDADARAEANAWLDEQKMIKREIKPRTVTRLLQMTAVASRLKRADAAQWLDYAAAVATQLNVQKEADASSWRGPLSRLNYADVTRFVEGRAADDAFPIWAYVVPAWAKAGDLENARTGLARLKTMMKTPEIIKLADEAKARDRVAPSNSLERAQIVVAGALARSDAPAAWAMADEIKDEFNRLRAMALVGESAARAGNAETAEKAARDILQIKTGNTEYYAFAAAIGARVRPDLGAELFAAARTKIAPNAEASFAPTFSPPTIGVWAFYRAPFDPALSRVLIEREWNWRLPAVIKSKNESYSREQRAAIDLIKAMARVDVGRAREMQAQFKAVETRDGSDRKSQFYLGLLQLATPQQSAELGMDLNVNY